MGDDTDLVLAVTTRLNALTQITALVDTRIYRRDDIPETPTTPYIVVYEIGDPPSGSNFNTNDSSLARVQCSCFASKDREAAAISKTLKKRLPCNDVILTAGTEQIRVTYLKDAGDIPDENAEIPLYMRHRDFRILYAY
jgi:hypothetical protein